MKRNYSNSQVSGLFLFAVVLIGAPFLLVFVVPAMLIIHLMENGNKEKRTMQMTLDNLDVSYLTEEQVWECTITNSEEIWHDCAKSLGVPVAYLRGKPSNKFYAEKDEDYLAFVNRVNDDFRANCMTVLEDDKYYYEWRLQDDAKTMQACGLLGNG